MVTGITVGALKVRIGLDDSDLDKGFDKAESKTKGFGKKIAGAAGKAGAFIGKAVLAGTVVAISALAGFSAKAISVASDLEEVQNVVDTTFEEMAGDVDKFAKGAAFQFGLSELAAKEFASGIGAILTPTGLGTESIADMSQSLTGLSGDMASFFNVASEDAFGALRAGIIGETEPLKRFGIVMSQANLQTFALAQGNSKLVSEMTQAELATLRYQFIMDATSKVQGDFAKTSDSLANQQRIASLNVENLAGVFGKKLLPIAGSALKGINTLVTGLMPQFELLAGSLGQLLTGQEGAAENFKKNATTIVSTIADALKDALPTIITVVESIIPVIIETLAILFPMLIELIASSLPGIIASFLSLIPMLIKTLSAQIPLLLDAGVQILFAILDGIVNSLPALIGAAQLFIKTFAENIVGAIPILVDTAIEILETLVQGFISSLPIIIDAAISIIFALVEGLIQAIPLIIEVVPDLIMSLLDTIVTLLPVIIEAAVGIVLALTTGLTESIPLLVEAIPSLIETIVETIIDLLPLIIDASVEIILALSQALIDNAPLLLGAILDIGKVLVEGIIKLIPALFDAGKQLINGVIDGMKAIDFGAFIESLGTNVIDKFKSFFGIESPSKKMQDQVGKNLGLGMLPDESTLSKISNGINSAVDSVMGGATGGMSPAMAGAGGINITIENISIPNATPEEAEKAGKIFGETVAVTLARKRGNL